MTEDAWVVAARSVEKMRTEIASLASENERLLCLLHDGRYALSVIENLRAALSRIVAAIPGQGPIPDVIDRPWTDSIVAAILSVEVRLADMALGTGSIFKNGEPSQEAILKIAELRKECGQHAMISMRNLEAKRKAEIANDHYAALLASQEKRVSAMDAECQKLRKLLVDPATEGLMRDRATMAAVEDIKSLRNQVAFLSEDQLRLIKERDNTKANYDSVARNLVAVTEQKDAAQTERDALRAQLVDRPARSAQDMVAEAGVLRDQYASELDSLYAYARDRLDPNRDILDGGRCACSPKYREMAPGVHAAYCPLAGSSTEKSDSERRMDIGALPYMKDKR